MLFRELVLENFGSYLGKNTINLLPDSSADSRPIILIGGMNGGGKTTIMDALRLALYGARAQCSTRGNLSYSDFLDQCVSRQTPLSEKTRVELAFEVAEEGELREIRIVRYWERNPKDGKDTLGILVNDWADKMLLNTWEEYIENLLPLGISNLFLFDGEQVKELAEQETPPVGVFDAIQSLLGLELAERLATDLDVLVTRKRRDIATSKQLEAIDEIESRLEQQQLELTTLTSELERLDAKLVVAIEQERQAFDKFVLEGGKIAAQGTELALESKAIQTQIDRLRHDLAELAAGNLPLGLIAPLLTEVRDRSAIELRHQQGKAALEVLVDRDRRLLEFLDRQQLLDNQIADVRAFLANENHNLVKEVELESSVYLGADLEVMARLDRILTSELDRDLHQASNLQTQLTKLEIELDFVDRQIAEAASPEEYTRLKAQETTARELVVQLKADKISSDRRYAELDRIVTKTKQELANYTEKNIQLKNDRHIIDSIAKVKATLQVFKEKLTLKKINKLENEVTECFRYLLHKSELVGRVTIDSTTFTLSLHDRDGKLLPKHRLSAGEKQLLAIALLWGLARVSGRQLPIAIDTPLGRLDSSHRTNLIERYFPAASEQVILLSTDTEVAESEVAKLREQGAITREYILEHDPSAQRTQVKTGYFW
ncbi:DNA sulfur modification protein DndD [Chamaesiphon minutus]|uniref:Nuclease SbcCD subunit C n=1 Tax=Chamaesiphon minutus (strain ATCC 27169 / PCC 6605) TaxID=1173020 RepID=K9UAA8_CHAP6|nr:DNA sulfur modification protein DndD [Chamaesiphon minutus]AFY92052.1 DNA sulfur modification protein DndD [Chamaesiphon minutus PCC 6605]